MSAPAQQHADDTLTVTFTREELQLLANALHAFVTDFGHDEAELLHQAKTLLTRLRAQLS